MADLRERVARAILDTRWGDGHWDTFAQDKMKKVYRTFADAAIDLVLEEAAKVADECVRQHDPLKKMLLIEDYRQGICAGAEAIAAAIRAMKGNP